MKLYTITISAHVDDLETLDVHIDADLELTAPEHQGIVLEILPAHLRKAADDIEGGRA